MAIDVSIFENDFDNIINDLPHVLTIAGITGAGVFTDFQQSQELEEGGFKAGYDANFHGRLAGLSAATSVGVTCSIHSWLGASVGSFRVDLVSKSPDDVEVRLDLTALSKK